MKKCAGLISLKRLIIMKNKKLLRRIAFVMLMVAVMFVGYALYHPEAGSAFYIGSFYIGSSVWRKFYIVYVLVMGALFLASYSNKK